MPNENGAARALFDAAQNAGLTVLVAPGMIIDPEDGLPSFGEALRPSPMPGFTSIALVQGGRVVHVDTVEGGVDTAASVVLFDGLTELTRQAAQAQAA